MKIYYEFGEVVYLKTDPDQHERIVTGILIRENSVMYELSYNEITSYHFDVEITRERNVIKATSN